MTRSIRFGLLFFSAAFLFGAARAKSSSPRLAIDSEIVEEARSDSPSLDFRDRVEAAVYVRQFMTSALAQRMRAEPFMDYAHACEPGHRIIIGAVGDVLLHQPLATQGMARSEGFRSLWRDLEPVLQTADFMYANLEGPAAGAVSAGGRVVADPGNRFDHVAYTSYPMFNYSPKLIDDLGESGFDVVSTANNHALDRRALGIDRTISGLKKYGMAYTGTRTVAEAARAPIDRFAWSTVTEKAGFRIGWIACTFGTNGIPDPKRQVLRCFEHRNALLAEIRRLHSDSAIDAIVVTPHWGVEYETVPRADQRKLAKDMIDAGALIVFGSHPHVLQPAEKLVARDGREGYVIYSLGNFVSGQKGIARRSSAAVFVGLTKTARGEVFINGARHLPLAMTYGSHGLRVASARGSLEEARLIANRILSRSRELRVEDPLVTNPECR